MKKRIIQCFETTMEEARAQVELLPEPDRQQRNTLSLLTEELFSMMEAVLNSRQAAFEIQQEGNAYALCLTSNAFVTDRAREEYLSLSKSGKNLAHMGFRGIMRSALEMITGGSQASAIPVSVCTAGDYIDSSQYWRLSSYLDTLSGAERINAWDGMEKSIIARFADDVLVGVKDHEIRVIVKKNF